MYANKNAARLFAFVLAVGLASPAHAAVIHKLDKDSQFAGYFKVTKEMFYDEIQITVTAAARVDGEQFASLRYSTDGKTTVTTNGSELTFVIDPAKLEAAVIYADYFDPNHDPEQTGGYSVYMLDVSRLAAEAE